MKNIQFIIKSQTTGFDQKIIRKILLFIEQNFNQWKSKEVWGNKGFIQCENISDILSISHNEYLKNKNNITIQYFNNNSEIGFDLSIRDQNYFDFGFGFPKNYKSNTQIDYLWKKLEGFYWELGGQGVLYAKVSDMKDFYQYAKQQKFSRASYGGSGTTFSWKCLLDEKAATQSYQIETHLNAPYYKVELLRDRHLFIQSYDTVFNYLDQKNLDLIESLFKYLSENKNTQEQKIEWRNKFFPNDSIS